MCCAADAASGAAADGERMPARPKYLAGGSRTCVDLMKEDIEQPDAPGGHHASLPLRQIQRTRVGPVAWVHWRATRRPPTILMIREQLPTPDTGHRRGRLRATAQHGDQRRQPDAAHALQLLLRHCHALQQARSPASGCGAREGLNRIQRRSSAGAKPVWRPTLATWPTALVCP